MDFQREGFGLFRSLADRIPLEAVLKGKGGQEGWTCPRKEIVKAQEQAVPVCQQMSWRARRLTWMKRELWLELQEKRKVYDQWKKSQAAQEDYKDTVRL